MDLVHLLLHLLFLLSIADAVNISLNVFDSDEPLYSDPENLLGPYCAVCRSFSPCHHGHEEHALPAEWESEWVFFEHYPELHSPTVEYDAVGTYGSLQFLESNNDTVQSKDDYTATSQAEAVQRLFHYEGGPYNAGDNLSPPDGDYPPWADSHVTHTTSSVYVPSNASTVDSGRTCRDFVWRTRDHIRLYGLPEATNSLINVVRLGYNRQKTSTDRELCALYALEISMSADIEGNRPTFEDLVDIHTSSQFEHEAHNRICAAGIQGELEATLLSSGDLSIEALLIILHLYGQSVQEVYQLGVCCWTGIPEQYNATLHVTRGDASPTKTVWVYNDNVQQDHNGLRNHYSGIAPDVMIDPSSLWPSSLPNRFNDYVPYVATQDGHKLRGNVVELAEPSSLTPERTAPVQSVEAIQMAPLLDEECEAIPHKAFPCDDCGKVYNRECDLTRHRNNHLPPEARRHKCPDCGHGFRYPREVTRHSAIHTGEKVFNCHVTGCKYVSSRKDNLKRHMQTTKH